MKELIDLIDLLLEDGVIEDNERSLIFRRAAELGISETECSILLNSMLGRYSKQKNDSKPQVEKTDQKKFRTFQKKEIKKIEPPKLEIGIDLEKKIEFHRQKIDELNNQIKNESKEFNPIISEVEKLLNEVEYLVNQEVEKLSEFKASFERKVDFFIDSMKKMFIEKYKLTLDFNRSRFFYKLKELPVKDAFFQSANFKVNKDFKPKINYFGLLFFISIPLFGVLMGLEIVHYLFILLPPGLFVAGKIHEKKLNPQQYDSEIKKLGSNSFNELFKNYGFSEKEKKNYFEKIKELNMYLNYQKKSKEFRSILNKETQRLRNQLIIN